MFSKNLYWTFTYRKKKWLDLDEPIIDSSDLYQYLKFKVFDSYVTENQLIKLKILAFYAAFNQNQMFFYQDGDDIRFHLFISPIFTNNINIWFCYETVHIINNL